MSQQLSGLPQYDGDLIDYNATDLNAIVDRIDDSYGRNDALLDYIYALRDLACVNNDYAIDGTASSANIEQAEDHVASAFTRLFVRQFKLYSEFADSGRFHRHLCKLIEEAKALLEGH